jgi:hypothetical protein
MNRPGLMQTIARLTIAGECAGFTVEQMIELLAAGLSVAAPIDLIATRLDSLGLLQADPHPIKYLM